MKRKSLSKKTRFDVFKRDKFTCSYCGKTPPAVTLEIDHIIPVAGGGENDIGNLITACFDCNRGKGAVQLTVVPQGIADNIAELREKEDQIKAFRKFIMSIQKRMKADIENISQIYRDQYDGYDFKESWKKTSLKRFLELLPNYEVEEAIYIAIEKYPDNRDEVIRYFCGVCWTKIKRNNGER